MSFYAHDSDVVAQASAFVREGLLCDEPALLVATPAHRAAIDRHLRDAGVDTSAARAQSRFVCLDAATTLGTFMRAGALDPTLFASNVGGLLEAAVAGHGSSLRVFGEMVALLWHDGLVGAALELEGLWNDLAQTRSFTLLCAYPTEVVEASRLTDLNRVCVLHSQVLPWPRTEWSPTAPGSTGQAGVQQRSRVFVPTLDAVGAARRFAAASLTGWGLSELSDDVGLLVSELATNAVRHARSPFLVYFHHQPGDVLLVGVKDVTQDPPAPQAPGEEDVSGRGLLLVDALSRRWGCDRLPDGKLVWAELSLAH